MHFGEYELSPSLISLSPLPTPHPEAFQRLSVRSSIPCYRNFNLDMGRSLGFASTPDDYSRNNPQGFSLCALFRLAFASAPYLKYLTSPSKVTRRFIMQKARRHSANAELRPLVGRRVQGLFHSFIQGAFHLSLTVLVHYRSLGSI